VAREKRRTGLSLSQIARHAELHRTHVFLILRGKRDIHISTLVKLASALGVKPGALLEGIEWEAGSAGLSGTFKRIRTTDRRSGIHDEATLA
jgi:transcriptional regulator with XRE-family HTH domain